MNFMNKVFAVGIAIIGTGLLLDELGQGKLGVTLKNIALKTTRGYGVGA